MRKGLFSLTTITLVALSTACTAVGRTLDRPTLQNDQQSAAPDGKDGGGANGEAPKEPERKGTLFKGSIGDLKIEMDLKREGDSLTGSYFYVRSGSSNRLTLRGKIQADESFTMQESDAAGKTTGQFQGKWKEDPNEPGGSLEGEWLKPGQTKDGQAFYAWEQMVFFNSISLSTRNIKEEIKAKKATLTAEYPELSGSPMAEGFNRLSKSQVNRSLSDFKKDLAGMTDEDIKMMGEMGAYIDVSYNVEYADDELISISFGEDSFLGGAHPNHGTATLTYDLKRGREVKLADLFKPGSKYLATIADYATRDLRARKDPESGENMGLASDIFEDGAKPTVANYANWNITKRGLMITFPPYQVAAYAYGPQTVIMPYSALKEIANADGPLSKFRK